MRKVAVCLVLAGWLIGGCGLATPSGGASSGPTPSAADASRGVGPSTAFATPEPTLYVGVFAPTGSMNTARYHQEAVVLADGTVLIVGGSDGTRNERGAELYDPLIGMFLASGSMTAERWHFTATLLKDGRVLIAGGQDLSGDQPVATRAPGTAELFLPATGTFVPTGAMTTAPQGQTATLLRDGRVLIVGGSIGGRSADVLSSAELYDPARGTFTRTGSMHQVRTGHTATLLADGRVLVVGGTDADGATFAAAEIYDPSSGAFATTGAMATARSGHTATLLPDGRVLVAGGLIMGQASFASAEIYDPATGTFTRTGAMKVSRYDHTASLLGDGRVLVLGGDDDNGLARSSAEAFDPGTGLFSPVASMSVARSGFSATVLPDGRVLVAGGSEPGGDVLTSAELFR